MQTSLRAITNFIQNIPGPLKMNQQTYRGDQNLGKLGSVFGRFTYSNYVNSANYNSGSAVLGLEQYFETGQVVGGFAHHQHRTVEREQLPLWLSLGQRA